MIACKQLLYRKIHCCLVSQRITAAYGQRYRSHIEDNAFRKDWYPGVSFPLSLQRLARRKFEQDLRVSSSQILIVPSCKSTARRVLYPSSFLTPDR